MNYVDFWYNDTHPMALALQLHQLEIEQVLGMVATYRQA
jgi:hypothetical protein